MITGYSGNETHKYFEKFRFDIKTVWIYLLKSSSKTLDKKYNFWLVDFRLYSQGGNECCVLRFKVALGLSGFFATSPRLC